VFVGQDDDWVAQENVQHINHHLIFLSSDEDEEQPHQQIMHHLTFLSSDEEELDNAQVLDSEDDHVDQDHDQVFLVDAEEGPRHTLILSSDDE